MGVDVQWCEVACSAKCENTGCSDWGHGAWGAAHSLRMHMLFGVALHGGISNTCRYLALAWLGWDASWLQDASH
jgi:hypothetical protein